MNTRREGKRPGSARVSRAGCGVSPQQSLNFLSASPSIASEKRKFAMTGTSWPARKTRALPGIRH